LTFIERIVVKIVEVVERWVAGDVWVRVSTGNLGGAAEIR
jgi:hypothetical protein